KTLISDYKLDEIYTEVKEIMHAYVEGNVKKSKIKKEPREVIITTCLTGQGAAITLANFLRNSISLISKYNIELFPTNSSDYRIEDFKNKRIIAVVGISDLNIAQVPFIPSEKILLDNGLSQLNEIIENYYSDSNGQQSFEMTNENGLRIILEETLTFLNPQKTITTLVHSFDGMKKDLLMGENSERYLIMFVMHGASTVSYTHLDVYKRQKDLLMGENSERYLIMFVMHGASMIERVIRNECIDYPDIESLIRAKSETYAILKKGMEEIESTFMLKVPDVEIGYLMDLFDTE
ncbi:PRD domain-containing protein, partial [Enterococcus sp. 3H8_DIV0648]|uniref:PRD domain-containing protein n=1 Tax=Enterococcus sp. 3H8_DIV0648 TaxID=1834178 RepID=UPI000B640844